MLREPERRIFLAKLLKIPPALLGLDWRLVVYEDNTGTHNNPPAYAEEIWLEDSYYHYEDTLAISWAAAYSGVNQTEAAERFERRLTKLEKRVKDISGPDREPWLDLLCRYYQRSMDFVQHTSTGEASKHKAIQRIKAAVQIATEIEDYELLVMALSRLSKNYLNYKEPELAREAVAKAMNYLDRPRNLTKGNFYLLAAEAYASPAVHDKELAAKVRSWQDKAMDMVYRGNVEPDGSFFRLNKAAVHHERAKTLLEFAQAQPKETHFLKDAQSEIKMAWDALTPDLVQWQMYFSLTEARLYIAERDLEGSAQLGLKALNVARIIQSKKGEGQVRDLYGTLKRLDERNPYVCNLGAQLGVF